MNFLSLVAKATEAAGNRKDIEAEADMRVAIGTGQCYPSGTGAPRKELPAVCRLGSGCGATAEMSIERDRARRCEGSRGYGPPVHPARDHWNSSACQCGDPPSAARSLSSTGPKGAWMRTTGKSGLYDNGHELQDRQITEGNQQAIGRLLKEILRTAPYAPWGPPSGTCVPSDIGRYLAV